MGGRASCGFLIGMKNSLPIRGRDRQKARPLAGPRRSPNSRLWSGYPLLRRGYGDTFSRCLSLSSRSPAATGGIGKPVNSMRRT
jgi:hypothetical protein